jgi:DNA transformation protein
MKSLTSLRNIGPRSARWLDSVGVNTPENLYDIGAVETYFRVKAAYPDLVSINMLYALQGAILDIPWNELPQELKDDLRRQADEP